MGSLFSGQTKTKTASTSDSNPSTFQAPYLTDAFNSAQSNYDASKDTPYYTGETYAGMSDAQKSALTAMSGYASGTGLNTANQLTSLGSSLTGNAAKAGTALDQFTTLAGTDATKSNIAAAGQYADNPYLSSQIDAANRDVTRQLNEQTLPGIDRTASGSGNLNSSRAGVAQGIAMRGAADQEADTAANMRGQAYSQGLTLAQQDRAQQLSALSTAAQGYQGLANTGINALGQGTQAGYGAYDEINKAGTASQADQQGKDTAAFNQWQGQDTRASDLLSRYMATIGANQWGSSTSSTGTQTGTSTPSLLNDALGIASAAAAFM